MERYSGDSHVNVGWGTDVSIAELARLVAGAVGYEGGFRYASDKPDGAPRKLLDVSRLAALGWRPRIGLPRAWPTPIAGSSPTPPPPSDRPGPAPVWRSPDRASRLTKVNVRAPHGAGGAAVLGT